MGAEINSFFPQVVFLQSVFITVTETRTILYLAIIDQPNCPMEVRTKGDKGQVSLT